MIDGRKHTRFSVMCHAECMNIEVKVLDISKEGMRIKSSCYIEHKNDISFRVILSNLDIINISGDIIWDRKIENDEYYYGIKIRSLSEEHESTFLSFIDELKTANIKLV